MQVQVLISVIILVVHWPGSQSLPDEQSQFYSDLARRAASLADNHVEYDPAYFSIAYPGGDIPADKGVCTDVVIRAYRKMDIDLQQLVHEDMQAHFDVYPSNWGLSRPDPNIDHRRVPNLMTYFTRENARLPITRNPADYRPGDIVCWDLGRGLLHIGLVVSQLSADGNRHLIIHNIGAGQNIEDVLFAYKIIGHYRFGDQVISNR